MSNSKGTKKFASKIITLVVSMLLVYSPMASAAMQMFMVIDDIPGESKDSVFKDSIDVMSFGWGLSREEPSQGGGGGGVLRVDEMSIIKSVDNASIGLMMSVSSGAPIHDALLVVRRAGEKPLEYFAMQLENVIITKYEISGSEADTGIMETVTLTFDKITTHYRVQDETGKGGPVKSDCYDVKANASCN